MMNKIRATDVLIVGCGDLGLEIASQLLHTNLNVIGLRRQAIKDSSFPIISADVTRPETLKILSEFNPACLIYCVSAHEQTDENYQQIYVQGLKNTLAALANTSQLQHVFFVSSTRMYGQEGDTFLDEDVKPEPCDFGGRRLLEAEAFLHQSAKASSRWGSTALRLTGIYGPGRTRMMDLARNVARWPESNTWTNRIHRDDAAAFVTFLIQSVLAKTVIKDCYIVSDSYPAPMLEVLSWIANKIGTSVGTEKSVGGGKRMSNQRMLATGFNLKYPSYVAGYGAIMTNSQ